MSFKIGALAVMLVVGGAPAVLGGSASAAAGSQSGAPVPTAQRYLECGVAPGPCTPGCEKVDDGSNCSGTEHDVPPVERRHSSKPKPAPDHSKRHNPGRRPVN